MLAEIDAAVREIAVILDEDIEENKEELEMTTTESEQEASYPEENEMELEEAVRSNGIHQLFLALSWLCKHQANNLVCHLESVECTKIPLNNIASYDIE